MKFPRSSSSQCYKACRILNSQTKKESLKSPSRAPRFTGTEEVWKAGDDKRKVEHTAAGDRKG